MKLIPEQKRFVREHFKDMSVREMAGHLGVEPKDVRWAMAELGLVPKEIEEREAREGKQRSRAWRRERWRQRFSALKRAAPGFWLMTCLALVVRMVHLVMVWDDPLLTEPIGIADVYHQWGILVAQGDWLSNWEPVFYHAPVYAYLLGAVYTLAGPSPLLVVILQVLLSAVSAGLILLLGRRIFGPVCGLLAGSMAVVYGMFVHQASLILPETLVVFLAVAGLVALVGALQRHHPLRWLWAGFVLGLLVASRGPLVLFVPLSLVAVITWLRSKGAKSWVPACLLLLFGTCLAVAPVTLHNRLVGGEWVTLTASFGPDLYTGNHRGADGMAGRPPVYRGKPLGSDPGALRTAFGRIADQHKGFQAGSAAAMSRFWSGKTIDDISSDKGMFFELLARKARLYFSAHEVPASRFWATPGQGLGIAGFGLPFGALAPLAWLGLVISIRGFRKRGVLVWFVLAHLLGLLAFWVDARHRLPVVPVMMVYSAAMLRWLWQKATKRRWLPLLITGCLVAAAFVATWWPLPDPPAIPPPLRAVAPKPSPPAAALEPKPAEPAQASPAVPTPIPAPMPGIRPADEPDAVRFAPPGGAIPQ